MKCCVMHFLKHNLENMKNLTNILTIAMLSFSAFNSKGQALEHLPAKVKSQKVDITLYSEEEIEGYLVDVVKDTVFTVKEKSMVKEAIQDGCMTCTKILKRNIYDVELRQSVVNGIVIGAAILGAGIIWSMGGDDHNPDGISERALRMMTFSVYGGSALAMVFLINRITGDGSYDLNNLKKKSSKTRFYRKCTETVRAFSFNGRLNKTYSFYVGNNFKKVIGKVVHKDLQKVKVIHDKTEREIDILMSNIKCVKD